MLRLLTILLLLAALVWGGYWFVGARGVERGVAAAIEEARRAGWRIELAELSVGGFPNRFDSTASDLRIATPDGAWEAALPFLQVFALSYRPGDVIAVPARSASLSTPAGPVALVAEDLRASATLGLSVPPELRRAVAVAEALELEGTGWRGQLAGGRLALRRAEGAAEAFDVAALLTDLALGGAALPSWLPASFGRITLDGTAAFDRPPAAGGRIVSLSIREASTRWEGTRLALSGELGFDAAGRASGDLSLALEGWEALLPRLAAAGLSAAEVALLGSGLAQLERDGLAEVPLTLRDGTLRFGAVPLGVLPPLPVAQRP